MTIFFEAVAVVALIGWTIESHRVSRLAKQQQRLINSLFGYRSNNEVPQTEYWGGNCLTEQVSKMKSQLRAFPTEAVAEDIAHNHQHYVDLHKMFIMLCRHLGVEYFKQVEEAEGFKKAGQPAPITVSDLPAYLPIENKMVDKPLPEFSGKKVK